MLEKERVRVPDETVTVHKLLSSGRRVYAMKDIRTMTSEHVLARFSREQEDASRTSPSSLSHLISFHFIP